MDDWNPAVPTPASSGPTQRLIQAPLEWTDSSPTPTAGFAGEQRFHRAVVFVLLIGVLFVAAEWLARVAVGSPLLPASAIGSLYAFLGLAVVTVLLQRLGAPAASNIHAAIVFEVTGAIIISYPLLLEPELYLSAKSDPSVTVWIVFFGTFVTMPPLATAWGALLSALVPTAMMVFAFRDQLHQPAVVAGLALFALLPFAMAGWVIWLSKRHQELATEASAARELGSYRLLGKIGQGGMGEVWRARHRTLAREAAVKVIRASKTQQHQDANYRTALRRFEREASIIATLRSPHTVQLYDFGISLDSNFYYVMELLPGMDLEKMVKYHGPLPAGRVIHLLRQACLSLAEAHGLGVIHRDIKPSNLFCCHLGVQHDFLKVLDFGLAKHQDSADAQLTAAGSVAGTPAYIAPESLSGQSAIDARADVYSLACAGYYLLTGKPVFEGPTPLAVSLAHLEQEPCPPSLRVDRSIPGDLEALILRCLSKQPEHRPPTMLALEQELAACGSASDWDANCAARWWQCVLSESRGIRPNPDLN